MDPFGNFGDVFSKPPSQPSEMEQSKVALDFGTIMQSSIDVGTPASTGKEDKKAMAFTDIMQGSLLASKEQTSRPSSAPIPQSDLRFSLSSPTANSETSQSADPFADFGSLIGPSLSGNENVTNLGIQEDPFSSINENSAFKNSGTGAFGADPFGSEDPFSKELTSSGFEVSTADMFGDSTSVSTGKVEVAKDTSKSLFTDGNAGQSSSSTGLADLSMIEMDASFDGLNVGTGQNPGMASAPSGLGNLDFRFGNDLGSTGAYQNVEISSLLGSAPAPNAANDDIYQNASSNDAAEDIYLNFEQSNKKSSSDTQGSFDQSSADDIYLNFEPNSKKSSSDTQGAFGQSSNDQGIVSGGFDAFDLGIGLSGPKTNTDVFKGPDNLGIGFGDHKGGANSASGGLFGDLDSFAFGASSLNSKGSSRPAPSQPVVESSNESNDVRKMNGSFCPKPFSHPFSAPFFSTS